MITGLLTLASPRLPERRWTVTAGLCVGTVAMHVLAVALLLVLPGPRTMRPSAVRRPPEVVHVVLPRIIFQESGSIGGGGGGGGNRQSGPIRHAEGIGHDAATLRTRKRAPAPQQPAHGDAAALHEVVLDGRPLASGNAVQIGLPVGGVSYGTSTGPGSGGGVGTGSGTGIGSGRGPGVGPGSGGGTGGGVYRPGGTVTTPRLLSQVKPSYTSDALGRKIQGSVWLEIVVSREGRVDEVRVIRSLDPAGLDEQAVAAVRRWQFEPGRLAGAPVDVMVTVVMDFSIQ